MRAFIAPSHFFTGLASIAALLTGATLYMAERSRVADAPSSTDNVGAMLEPAAINIALALLGVGGVLLWSAASLWMKAAREREAPNERPAIPVHAFRAAAVRTALAFGVLGAALVWAALMAFLGAL